MHRRGRTQRLILREERKVRTLLLFGRERSCFVKDPDNPPDPHYGCRIFEYGDKILGVGWNYYVCIRLHKKVEAGLTMHR